MIGLYCYKCHCLLHYDLDISIDVSVFEHVYSCPECKYKIVVRRKKE